MVLSDGYRRLALLLAAALTAPLAWGEDWPTYRHDNRRSGCTPERLALPLHELWCHKPRHAPRPAWPPPAKQDFWHRLPRLQPMVTFDRAFRVAVADGAVAFGSSADDRVCCLDAATGKARWSFFTGGPVRLAPTLCAGKVYVGSDDGRVYCLDAAKGTLVWARGPAGERQLIGNGRMISAWPVRTGVLVADGVAYYAAGLFPNDGVHVVALDARDGSERWTVTTDRLSPQGGLLASGERLYVPTGRTSPALFRRRDGRYMGVVKGAGGAFALLAQGRLIHGPGRTGQLDVTRPNANDRVFTFGGLRMVAAGGRAYLQTTTSLSALDHERYLALIAQSRALVARQRALEARLRKLAAAAAARTREKPPVNAPAREGKAPARKAGPDEPPGAPITKPAEKDPGEEIAKVRAELAALQQQLRKAAADAKACTAWRRPCPYPYELILAADVLFAGGDGCVAAFRAKDGKELWSGKVAGRAYGLAVAGGRLFVSTDKGTIHCFGQKHDEP